jgi:hypothetical protein
VRAYAPDRVSCCGPLHPRGGGHGGSQQPVTACHRPLTASLSRARNMNRKGSPNVLIAMAARESVCTSASAFGHQSPFRPLEAPSFFKPRTMPHDRAHSPACACQRRPEWQRGRRKRRHDPAHRHAVELMHYGVTVKLDFDQLRATQFSLAAGPFTVRIEVTHAIMPGLEQT